MNEGGGPPQTPAEKAKQDALYEDREPKKIIRIITVVAYMCSVSFVGMTLSAYYIFLWHPPNPRLMHQQAAHHQARVDYLYQPPDFVTDKAVDPNVLDLFKHANPGVDTLKTRREIVKNVNAILSANFEKVRFTEASSSSTTEQPDFNVDIETNSSSSSTTIRATEDSSNANDNFTAVSTNDSEKSSSESIEESSSSSDDKTTTASTLTSSRIPALPRTKSPGRKPHQTPFALKHLEVPIKLEPTRRRLIRFSTTTTTTTMKSDTSTTTDGTNRGTLSDASAAVTASSSDSSEIFDNSSPRHVAKSLYKMLTSPPSLTDMDYPSSTDLPQIFPAVAHADNDNDDYHDATIAPMDDILDD